jgi:hypothetical protein
VIRVAAALAAFAALAACSAAAAPPTRVVRLAAPPDTLVAGQRWAARLTVRPPVRPSFRATSADTSLTSRATATGRGRYTAIVRFPSAGIWRLAAVVRGRTFPLGRVRVLVSMKDRCSSSSARDATGFFASTRRPVASLW